MSRVCLYEGSSPLPLCVSVPACVCTQGAFIHTWMGMRLLSPCVAFFDVTVVRLLDALITTWKDWKLRFLSWRQLVRAWVRLHCFLCCCLVKRELSRRLFPWCILLCSWADRNELLWLFFFLDSSSLSFQNSDFAVPKSQSCEEKKEKLKNDLFPCPLFPRSLDVLPSFAKLSCLVFVLCVIFSTFSCIQTAVLGKYFFSPFAFSGESCLNITSSHNLTICPQDIDFIVSLHKNISNFKLCNTS